MDLVGRGVKTAAIRLCFASGPAGPDDRPSVLDTERCCVQSPCPVHRGRKGELKWGAEPISAYTAKVVVKLRTEAVVGDAAAAG